MKVEKETNLYDKRRNFASILVHIQEVMGSHGFQVVPVTKE